MRHLNHILFFHSVTCPILSRYGMVPCEYTIKSVTWSQWRVKQQGTYMADLGLNAPARAGSSAIVSPHMQARIALKESSLEKVLYKELCGILGEMICQMLERMNWQESPVSCYFSWFQWWWAKWHVVLWGIARLAGNIRISFFERLSWRWQSSKLRYQ